MNVLRTFLPCIAAWFAVSGIADARSIRYCQSHVKVLIESCTEGQFVMVVVTDAAGAVVRATAEEVRPASLRPYAQCMAEHADYYFSASSPSEPTTSATRRIPINFLPPSGIGACKTRGGEL